MYCWQQDFGDGGAQMKALAAMARPAGWTKHGSGRIVESLTALGWGILITHSA